MLCTLETNHPHSLSILFVRRKSHSDSFFTRTTTLWNRLQSGCFPNKYWINHYLFYNLYTLTPLKYIQQPHSETLYFELPMGLVLYQKLIKKNLYIYMQLHELASSLFTHSIQILSRSSFFFTYVLYMTQNKGYQKYFAFNNGMKSDASAG